MAYFGFTNKLLKGETIEIFNYGNCKRDFTYVADIVEGVKRVMQGAPEKRLVKTVSLFLRMRSIISVIPAPKTCWTSWISYSRN